MNCQVIVEPATVSDHSFPAYGRLYKFWYQLNTKQNKKKKNKKKTVKNLTFIRRIIFGKEHKSLSSSLRSFLQSPVSSTVLGTNIFLSKEVWNDVYNCLDVNCSLEAFLGTFLHSFNIAFPYKTVNLRER